VLAVTIVATGAGNVIREVHVGEARNATIDVGGLAGPADFSVTLSGTSASVVTVITRARAGETVHVPLVILDLCGDWRTFVGGGPTSF
jgi:hypothetical protein